ncbi:MAG: dihydroorotase [candidate division Zixibacteria bacterium HGW-Zixibacteria-1]|nr:MAG: dihydroorotase [candidate division Zixibacteria bacterium HGW-Zixibacteria-1]
MKSAKYDLVIKGGRVIDPTLGFVKEADVFVKDGVIAKIAKETQATLKEITSLPAENVIDASGKIVCPGLIDMHVHLREPGFEGKETIITGCRAAAAGGFTAVCCMPNTSPAIDNQETVRFVQSRAEGADARVYVVGAITKDLKGGELAEIGDLAKGGAVAVSDDGNYVQNPEIMRRALEYAQMFDIPIITHAEDEFLCGGGVMNESFEGSRLGMKGRPAVGEVIAVLRDIKLCQFVGGRLHIAHVSTAGAVEAIRQAKLEGVNVTAEAAPHHFTLTDDEIGKEFNTNLKVNPPLRTRKDVDAVIKGLVDGTIDCIASDHAPHSEEDKDVEFDQAPSGMIGLETTLSLVKSQLIDKGYLSWADAIRKMTQAPARILRLPGGTLEKGCVADITVIDPDRKWILKKENIHSKSQNSPFIGWKLTAKVTHTILGGRLVYTAK